MNVSLKSVFFTWIEERLKRGEDIYLISFDLGFPEMPRLCASFPERALNVGVAEQNGMLLAAGLSQMGAKVYLYGASSFTLWRSAEVIKLYSDNLKNAVIVGNGGGLGYGIMGESHHNINDYGLLNLMESEIITYLPFSSEQMNDYLDLSVTKSHLQYFRLVNPKPEFHALVSPPQEKNVQKIYTTTSVIIGPTMLPEANHKTEFFLISKWPCSLDSIIKSAKETKSITLYEEHLYSGSISQVIERSLPKDLRISILCLSPDGRALGDRDFMLKSRLTHHQTKLNHE